MSRPYGLRVGRFILAGGGIFSPARSHPTPVAAAVIRLPPRDMDRNSTYDSAMTVARMLIVLTVSLLVAMAASAQPPASVPRVKPDNEWIAVVIAIVLLLCAGAVTVMPPKRTHQD